jgi:hypothetical protein
MKDPTDSPDYVTHEAREFPDPCVNDRSYRGGNDLDPKDWVLVADRWLSSALAWAARGNKRQTIASLREYDRTLAEAFK